MQQKEWFETWFNSPYYHKLYQHRNDDDASKLIDNLFNYLNPEPNSKILDLACGKGRHAAYIARKGYPTTGVDLSEYSIKSAIINYNIPNLEFYTHDMRDPVRIHYFDYVFNFFTSFGYFNKPYDNKKVLKSVHQSLKPGGKFLIDFMNTTKVVDTLIEREKKEVDEIHFYIRREYLDNKILKHIKFDADGRVYSFTERVQALMPYHFHNLFSETKFKILAEFGNYNLEPFEAKKSERYMVLVEKI